MRLRSNPTSETGSSLLTVILLLMVVSGLTAAMVSSSMTDTMVSRNHHSGAQAQSAAEAGLNHAIDAARVFLRDWDSNYPDTKDAVSRLLRGPDNDAATTADNGSLAPDAAAPAPWLLNGTPTAPATLALAGVPGVRYEARVHDDDDPALGQTWQVSDLTRLEEGTVVAGVLQPDPVVDRNGYFVVRSTGYAAGNTVVTVEALMKPMPWPAIVTNGDLLFEGTPKVLGDGGSVHSNSDIRVNGNGTEIEKDVTAVGTVDTGAWSGPEDGIAEGGQLPISLPHVLVSDYLSQAKYRLGSDGAIYLIAGNHQICNSNASCAALEFGWSSQAGAHVSGRADILRTWDVGSKPSTLAECNTLNAALAAAGDPSPDCGQGVFYVEHGDIEVKASSKLGEAPQVPSPFKLTLLVDGSVDAAGRAVISAYLEHPRLLLVTEGDLEITGHMTFSGQVRVREQFRLAGTMDLTGQILVENDGDISSKVHENKMEGTATVTNDRLAVYDFAVAGWREFRR